MLKEKDEMYFEGANNEMNFALISRISVMCKALLHFKKFKNIEDIFETLHDFLS